jgi:uncharacterized protein (TIGR02246 family)
MSIRRSRLTPFLLLLALSCGAERPAADEESGLDTSTADRTSIRELIRTQTGAINRSDLDTVLACLHPSVVYMPCGEPRAEGRDAVRETLSTLFSRYEVNVSYQSQEVEVLGERAFERGQFVRRTVARGDGATTVVNGSVLRILAREADGSWLVLREAWATHPSHE